MVDMSEGLNAAESRRRIEELEARVKWLEGALTSLLQQRRPKPAQPDRAPMFTLDDDDVLPATSGEHTQPMEVLRGEPPAPDLDAMRFTHSFAILDEVLREQLEAEGAVQVVPEPGHPVMIDPDLIDRAFARPAPELIEVRCALEEQFPNLLQRVTVMWGEPEAHAFLQKLIVDERGGRQGFPFDVMSELLVLSGIAEARARTDKWE
jgi:hypothetical protein